MSADTPPFPDPRPGDPLPLRPLPPGWVAPKIKEIPLLTLAGVLRHLHDTIEEASSMADTIDYQLLEATAFELEEAKRRWESDHPSVAYGTNCMCICGIWAHSKSICKEYAEEHVGSATLNRKPIEYYTCTPCRTAVEEHGDT